MPEPLHAIHASLWRPILFAGVDQGFLLVEVCIALALVVVGGIHLWTVGLAVFYLTAFHSLIAWLTAKDPEISAVYLRSLRIARYYPATATLRGRRVPVYPAVPEAR
jgi:type IV secretory pathway TrbD component